MIREGFTLKTALRRCFKPQSSAKCRKALSGKETFLFHAPLMFVKASLKTALRKRFEPQPFRGFVGATGFSDMFEKGGMRLHDVFRRGSIGRYADRSAQAGLSGFEVSHQEHAK
jgi:hypothetical protein